MLNERVSVVTLGSYSRHTVDEYRVDSRTLQLPADLVLGRYAAIPSMEQFVMLEWSVLCQQQVANSVSEGDVVDAVKY